MRMKLANYVAIVRPKKRKLCQIVRSKNENFGTSPNCST